MIDISQRLGGLYPAISQNLTTRNRPWVSSYFHFEGRYQYFLFPYFIIRSILTKYMIDISQRLGGLYPAIAQNLTTRNRPWVSSYFHFEGRNLDLPQSFSSILFIPFFPIPETLLPEIRRGKPRHFAFCTRPSYKISRHGTDHTFHFESRNLDILSPSPSQ